MRARSSKFLFASGGGLGRTKHMEQALNYKFKLQDLNKYSKSLRYKDINWVLSSRKAMHITQELDDREFSKEQLKKLMEQ